MRTTTRWSITTAVTAALAVLLSACGGSGSSTDAADGTVTLQMVESLSSPERTAFPFVGNSVGFLDDD